MSALLRSASPMSAAPLPTASRSNGFFAHHGVWAPGVRLFRRLGFTAKAVIISLAFMLPMLGLLGWTLRNQAEQSLQARRDALRQQVQVAHGLLGWAHAQETQGKLARTQAQQLALQALRALRHDGDEPFWVQDLERRVLVHAGQPELEGQSLKDWKLAGGLAVFSQAASKVRADGHGFLDVAEPGPGLAQGVPKLSYVMGFEPWGWVVGSSASASDTQPARRHELAWIGVVVALAMLASGYLFLSFYRVMDGGLRETRRHLRAMSEGDLTTSPRGLGQGRERAADAGAGPHAGLAARHGAQRAPFQRRHRAWPATRWRAARTTCRHAPNMPPRRWSSRPWRWRRLPSR